MFVLRIITFNNYSTSFVNSNSDIVALSKISVLTMRRVASQKYNIRTAVERLSKSDDRRMN